MRKYSLQELDNFASLLTRRQARKLYEAKTNKEYNPEYINAYSDKYEDDDDLEDKDKHPELCTDADLEKLPEYNSDDIIEQPENADEYESIYEEDDFDYGLDEPDEEDRKKMEDLEDTRVRMKIIISEDDLDDLSIDDFFEAAELEGFILSTPETENYIEEDEDELLAEGLHALEDEEDDLYSLEEIIDTKEERDSVYVYQEDEDDEYSDIIIVYPIDRQKDVKNFLLSVDINPETVNEIMDMADYYESDSIDFEDEDFEDEDY